jgi:hypothetical protein
MGKGKKTVILYKEWRRNGYNYWDKSDNSMHSPVMDIAIKTRYTSAAYCKNLMLLDSLF